jgi:hypothetical protein
MIYRKDFETAGHNLFEEIILAFVWKDYTCTIPQSEYYNLNNDHHEDFKTDNCSDIKKAN